MVIDTKFLTRLLSVCLAVFTFSGNLFAADKNTDKKEDRLTGEIVEKITDEYSYQIDANGNPVFTQVLKWESDSGVLKYVLEITRADGTAVYTGESTESTQTVSLAAGNYLYRIIAFNLLGKEETASEWSDVTVKKAMIPVIRSFSPGIIYIDEGLFRITLRGKDIFPDSEVYLDDPVLGIHLIEPIIQSESEEGKLELLVPEDKLDTGTYKISVVNPGGLKDRTEETIRVGYINPFEFFAAVGWSGWVPLYDSWYTDNWNGKFYPVGIEGSFSWVFRKKRIGFFGVQLQGGAKKFSGGDSDVAIRTTNLDVGLSLFWKRKLSQKFCLIGTVGGGSTWTGLTFEYKSGGAWSEGSSEGSLDPNVTAGLDLQYLQFKKIYVDIGVHYKNIFYKGKVIGGIVPVVSIGRIF